MAAVVDEQKAALGIITLEDVIEELIGEEIEDETDFLQKNSALERLVGASLVSIDALSSLSMRSSTRIDENGLGLSTAQIHRDAHSVELAPIGGSKITHDAASDSDDQLLY